MSESTRERLLDAALRRISESGYLGTSTKEIATAAGVAEITLFRHFGSKENLFAEMLKRHAFGSQLRGMVRELEDVPAADALSQIGLGFLSSLEERKALIRIMLGEVSRYPEAVRLIYGRFIDEMVDTLGRYLATRVKVGELRQISTRTVARAFLDALFAYFLTEVIIAGRQANMRTKRRTVHGFGKIFLDGIRAPDARRKLLEEKNA